MPLLLNDREESGQRALLRILDDVLYIGRRSVEHIVRDDSLKLRAATRRKPEGFLGGRDNRRRCAHVRVTQDRGATDKVLVFVSAPQLIGIRLAFGAILDG